MYEYNCKIVRVVDGDTVDVDVDLGWSIWRCGERIRLYGIDTPECRTLDAEEKAAGLLAKEFVEEALHVGGIYTLQTKRKESSGRYLGTIYLTDDTSINAALVKERLAVPYFGQSKVRVQEAHLANRKLLKEMGWL
jgi:micrococcal nuclease